MSVTPAGVGRLFAREPFHFNRRTPDGNREFILTGPDGQEWADERLPVYRRPPWIPLLFSDEDAPGDHSRTLRGYKVLKALRFSGSGGGAGVRLPEPAPEQDPLLVRPVSTRFEERSPQR